VSDASLQPILALLGFPVAANPTQYMMEKAFAQHQLDYRFLTVEVAPADLGDAIRGMRAMGFAGGTFADPHRDTAGEHMGRLSETARLSGVVNCFFREDDALVGENTEGQALLAALAAAVDPAGKRVVLLGAGRMARSIAVELALAKVAHLTIVSRTPERAAALAGLVHDQLHVPAVAQAWEEALALPPETAILVNASTMGREEAEMPLAADSLRSGLVVADVTLDPPRTPLVEAAQAAGCTTIDGLELFIQQSAVSIQRWTGVEPDATVMREAVEEFLAL